MTNEEWFKIITSRSKNNSLEGLRIKLKHKKRYKNPSVKVLKVGSVTCQHVKR